MPDKLRHYRKEGPASPIFVTMGKGSTETRPVSSRWRALFLFLVAFLINFNTLPNSWALDDTLLITQNTFTKQGFQGIPAIWSHDVFTGYLGKGGIEQGGRYRPLSQSAFAVCYALFGPNPFIGHLLNVLLYACTCVLLFKVLQSVLPTNDAGASLWSDVPFLAALAFALHPLHAEVVANIKSLDEILAMLFALGAAWFALRSNAARMLPSTIPCGLCFFLALCAKENAITFPAVIPLMFFYAERDRRWVPRIAAALVVPALLYFALRAWALSASPAIPPTDDFLTNPFHGATLAERLATVMLTWWKYLGLILFPHPLTTDYYPAMIPVIGWSDVRAWLGLGAFAAAAVYGAVFMRQRSVPAFGILFFLITFSVVSNAVVNLGTPMNDRFLFMPLAGACVVIAWLFAQCADRLRSSGYARVAQTCMVLVFCAYAARTFSRNADWKDDLTLFTHDVQVSDKSARCQVMTGKLCYERGSKEADPALKQQFLDKARTHLERGLVIYDRYALAWGLLGAIEMESKNWRKSGELFVECLKCEPAEPVALKNLFFVARRMREAKDIDGAESAFRSLLLFDKTNAEVYLQLADLLMRNGKAGQAIPVLDSALVHRPDLADTYRLKGEVQAVYLNEPQNAEENFLKALELDPRNVGVLDNLGVAAFKKGDFPRALDYFLRATGSDTTNADALSHAAKAYEALGRKEEAVAYAARAQQAARKAR